MVRTIFIGAAACFLSGCAATPPLVEIAATGQVYTYHGIGSRGRNETQTAVYRDGVFEFTNQGRRDGKAFMSRDRMGPFSAREVPFISEVSLEGGPWVREATLTYVRLD